MVCPRCDAVLKYGTEECPSCGLRFKYNSKSKPAASRCKRSTAAIMAYLFGFAGIHNFYMGYFVRGAARLVLFVAFCGVFISPHAMQLVTTGTIRITFDYLTVIGLVLAAFVILSWMVSIAEFVFIVLGKTGCDSKGLPLI